MTGKRNILRELVCTNSSVCPTGIIVRKLSNSLKVFIASNFDIYPLSGEKEDIDFIVMLHGRI